MKSRRRGSGFATLERWLAQYEALFLRRDHADPLIVLPWRMWARLNKEAGWAKATDSLLPASGGADARVEQKNKPSQRPYPETPSFGVRPFMTAKSKR